MIGTSGVHAHNTNAHSSLRMHPHVLHYVRSRGQINQQAELITSLALFLDRLENASPVYTVAVVFLEKCEGDG